MTTAEAINAVINGFIAFGTIAVAILAIWGDPIRAWIAGPKLKLIPHNSLRGSVVTLNNGVRSIYYHLKVINRRSSISAINCRVLLKKIWRKAPNGSFLKANLAVPVIYVWAPAEITPPYINLRNEHVLDFGRINQNEKRFQPLLLSYANNFEGFVQPNDTVRFGLEIVSDNFISKRLQIFEVAWNGQWSSNLETMGQNLQIREIPSDE
jgi:hypothetical protein